MSDNNQFEIIGDASNNEKDSVKIYDSELTSREHHGSNHHHHHHHHHHSHSSHQKKHHSKNNKKTTKKQLTKKDKKNLAIVAIEIAVALLACIVLVIINHSGDNDDVKKDNVVIDSGFIVKMPELFEPQPIVDDVIISCMELDDGVSFQSFLKTLRRDGMRFDIAKPVTMEVIFNNIPDVTVSEYKVYVSKKADLSDARVLEFTSDQKIEIDYLEVNTKYYYKIMALPTDYSVGGSFTTANTPRILNIDGIYNVRDIGGWKTVDGKVIRQGLLYRGTELDGQVNSDYTLTEKGKNVMLNILNIKFDMDLRYPTDNKFNVNALGNSVTRKYYQVSAYDEIFTAQGKETTRVVFADLAKPENYPIYMHCTHGADRAGTMCYLLEALLGLSEENLEREYELSTLYYTHISRDLLSTLKAGLMRYEGNNLQQKTENYLLSIGVTKDEIKTIKDIFLEKAQ